MEIKHICIESELALTPETLSMLFKMDQDYFPTPWGLEAWHKIFYSVGQRLILTVESEGLIIGFALLDISNADSFAHLLKIVVNPKLRAKGIGKNLLNSVVKLLNDRNIKSFFLEVEEQNTAAINLYESVGFRIIHQKKQFYSSGASALIMTLSI